MRRTMALLIAGFVGMGLWQTPCFGEIVGDTVAGKRLFLKKGSKGKACVDCHPNGHSSGKVVRGKKVPDLTERVAAISEKRLVSKATKHLEEDVGLDLTEADFNNLMAFVVSLPKSGF